MFSDAVKGGDFVDFPSEKELHRAAHELAMEWIRNSSRLQTGMVAYDDYAQLYVNAYHEISALLRQLSPL